MTNFFKNAQDNALRMTDKLSDYQITKNEPTKINIPDVVFTPTGLEVDIGDLRLDRATQIYTYKGKKVVVFIPDHSYNTKFDDVDDNLTAGNKIHVTECKTIIHMKKEGRGDRYFVNRNLDGMFEIFNKNNERKITRLPICKNCMKQLKYCPYQDCKDRARFVQEFNIADFLNEHDSQLGGDLPGDVRQPESYTEDWKEISFQYRKSQGWRCEKCHVDLSNHRHLLDTHHKNGVKSDNRTSNLAALCKLCHAQEPMHNHMGVSNNHRKTILQLRQEQKLRTWQQALMIQEKMPKLYRQKTHKFSQRY